MSRPEFTPGVLQECPSRDFLLSFLQGESEATDSLARHLETCALCQQSLDQLSRDSTLWPRGPAVTPWTPSPELLRQLHATCDTATRGADLVLPAMAGYRLVGVLGQGGMGVVYEGIQEDLGRSVALKTLRADKVNDELRARLRREAEAIAKLNHPNIVQIYEVGDWQPTPGAPALPYLAMERVVGMPLGQWLAGRPQSPQLAAELIEIMARAIHAAHEAGIVHRDLKPSNVLVQTGEDGASPSGQSTDNVRAGATSTDRPKAGESIGPVVLKITDFGLAKDMDAGTSLTDTGQMVGTPNYMAPEQVRAQAADIGPATDIYALGAMLFEMLTSRPPFIGKTPMEILWQVISVEPLAPRQILSGIPRDLDTICLKCLEKDPRKRYTTALELAEDLQRFRRGEPIVARPLGPIARSVRWGRRKPAVAGLWAAGVLLLLGSVATGFWFQHQRSVRATDELSRQAEARRKRDLAEQRVADAMGQAREIRKTLEAELRRPGNLTHLMNDPGRWSAPIVAARALLDRAAAHRDSSEAPLSEELLGEFRRLADQIQRDEADRLLALRLEKIRLDRSTWIDGGFDFALALREYPAVFMDAGLCTRADTQDGKRTLVLATSLIRQSVIKEQLLAAMDDWAYVAAYVRRFDEAIQLLAEARAIDPDPWRDQVRSLDLWRDRKALDELAAQALADEAEFSKLSPAILTVVGRLWMTPGGSEPITNKAPDANHQKAAHWLRHAQMRHPADFWLNLDLADVLLLEHPTDAAGYYRTALAVRRNSGAAWNNLGVALRLQKDLPAARHALRKAVEAEPRNARAWTTLGQNLLDEKDVLGAVKACRNAVAFEPRYAIGWNNLGNALSQNQDRQGALEAFKTAIEIEPTFAKAWYNLGYVLHEDRDFAGARKAYETARECDPRYDLPWFGLANLLQDENQLPAAIAAYRKAIALEGKRAATWYNLGNALRLNKDFAEAVTAYRNAIEIEPNLVSAWSNLGLALRATKDPAGAKEAFEKAIALNAKHANAWTNLGSFFYSQRDYSAAARAFRKAVEAEPGHAIAWTFLGNTLVDLKEFPAAADAYKKAILHDSKRASAWNGLGNIHFKQGDVAAALAAFEKSVEADSNYAKGWGSIGWIRMKKQDYPSAAEALRKSVALDGTNAQNWHNLGVSLRMQNLLPPAAEAFQKAITLKPSMSNSHLGLGLVYRDQGRFADAVASTNKGLALAPLVDRLALLPQVYECERLLALDKRLPLVLKGEKTNPTEQVALADLCFRYKDRPADAVRFYAAAFAAEKRLAEDHVKNHRTSAAYAAVRAAAATTDAAAQADLRRQALEWLRADLALGTTLLKAEPPPNLPALLDKLEGWRKQADLAAVRASKSLDLLPEGEKKSWLAFWSDVDGLERAVRAQITPQNKSR